MASCLGMQIEPNIIKYAKVSKEKEVTKVDAFGIKFYENLSEGIKQVIEETYSHKTPISINLSDEMYNFFDMFTLLGKDNLPKAIKTEFEMFCDEKDYNANAFETRYAVVENLNDKDKLKIIHISANKIGIEERAKEFEAYRLTNISPISMGIASILDSKPKENSLIVNMEDKTIITTIINQSVYDVETLEEGSSIVLGNINRRENSYSKAYEDCKNTTIYTADVEEIGQEQNFLEDIMPTLYDIVGKVKKKINSSVEKINNVYLTGTLSCVNNVDLYFQEYLPEVKCEILKPFFVQAVGTEISIKDYVEVNSAIALGLQGLNEGIPGMNFKKKSFSDSLPEWMKGDVGGKGKDKNKASGWLTFDFGQKMSTSEKILTRTAATILMIIIVYAIFASLLQKEIDKKIAEVDEQTKYTEAQIKMVEDDKNKIDTKTGEYKTMIQNLENINSRMSDINKSRNLIPNLLNEIMFVIPEEVQITSIENTTEKHVVINAQAAKYEQLGYFKAKLKTEAILTNVVSDSGVKDGSIVKVTIEGDLP